MAFEPHTHVVMYNPALDVYLSDTEAYPNHTITIDGLSADVEWQVLAADLTPEQAEAMIAQLNHQRDYGWQHTPEWHEQRTYDGNDG